jgi:DNA-binding Lrp family transcriptional regulator
MNGVFAMDNEILELLDKDSELTAADIAVMLDKTEDEVRASIERFKAEGIIVGKKVMINWRKTSKELVTALIELKVTPQFGRGFDQIAERFYQYDQVKSVYLMSGTYDLALQIEGKNLNEVALFVAEKLAPMEAVVSTATHFVLKKYIEVRIMFENKQTDDRQVKLF